MRDSRLPRLFVGSSTEGLDVAYCVQENLEFDAETLPWTQGIFKPTRQTLGDLVTAMHNTDFAVFILSADDVLTMRGKDYQVARDNVIFELGLFIGYLGVDRCFLLRPRDVDQFHLPSDLLGLTTLTFNSQRSDNNLLAALGTACNQIRRCMREAASAEIAATPRDTKTPEAEAQKFARLLAMWENDALKKDRSLISKGMPIWAGEDEDGKTTHAFERVCTFLNALADTVLENETLEIQARPVFETAVRNVWKHAQGYWVNYPHSAMDEYWENREYPPMKTLADRWSRVP